MNCVQILSARAWPNITDLNAFLNTFDEQSRPARTAEDALSIITANGDFLLEKTPLVKNLHKDDALLVFQDEAHPLVSALTKAQLLAADHAPVEIWAIRRSLTPGGGEHYSLWSLLIDRQDDRNGPLFHTHWQRGPFVASATRGKTPAEVSGGMLSVFDDSADDLLWQWIHDSDSICLRFDLGENTLIFSKITHLL